MNKISIFYNRKELSYSDHLLSCKVTAAGLSTVISNRDITRLLSENYFYSKDMWHEGFSKPQRWK